MKNFIKHLLPRYQKLVLDYPVNLVPRYSEAKGPHFLLDQIIGGHIQLYENFIDKILRNQEAYKTIKDHASILTDTEPSWNNGFLPGLDIVALYTFIKEFKPGLYLEIGSGNSTKVVRKSILDNDLKTKIYSIDPQPRANIDKLSDEVIRMPLENVTDSMDVASLLNSNDILFVDNSHRCLPNSDVTVFFLEILPKLKSGVIVHIHDVYLPYDYPQFMCDRFYSEQYLLATLLMANPRKYKPLFPAFYVSSLAELSLKLEVVWNGVGIKNIERHGGSFWFLIE